MNLATFADLYKPVIVDHLPLRAIAREDSSVLMVDCAATPITLTTSWQNMTLSEASEIFH
ncbi:hypothetical protein HOY82DRAFT_597436 [Tuber indicum]|nr:hypothetical protein HOY82DRAFT_597436 [Tuber indicum]